MNSLGVIPARANSTRFPNKIIAPINSKPMIQYVWEAAKKSLLLSELYVATDDYGIAKVVESFGGRVILTPSVFISGTDRTAWVSKNLPSEIVVNIQGDEPLIEGYSIDELIKALREDSSADIATFAVRKTNTGTRNPNVVKVIISDDGYAMDFVRDYSEENKFFFKHVGIYCFRYEALQKFASLPPTQSELMERLEQLRALDYGFKIRIVELKKDTIAVDTPEDILKVEEYLRNIERQRT